jgi:membrane fusion protein
VSPDATLFRRAAIEHYVAGEELGGVAHVSPPWTWALFAAVGTAVVVALTASAWARAEVTGQGRGVVRPQGGVRLLTTQVAGTVAEAVDGVGRHVAEGTPIVRLDSAPLRRELLEVERQIQLLESDQGVYSARQDASFAEQIQLLRARVAMLDDQVASQAESVRIFERKLQSNLDLAKLGLVSTMNVEDGREALAQSQRQLNVSKQNLAQARQELASLDEHRQGDLWGRQRDLSSARSKRDALAFTLEQLDVRAPLAGAVEAVVVKPGDVVQAGQVVGKLIPGDALFHVVSFLPEQDRAFVNSQDEVRLELDQLPAGEFGALKGRVVRIGADVASRAEVREALGDETRVEGSTYRVEIAVQEASLQRMAPVLRSGMLMTVRYTLRRPRLITLVLEPLRRWLD